MEFKNLKNQQGYLLIVAIIAIVIVGFVAGIFVNMYITSTRSTTNILQADQALYIAKAALEKGTYELTKKSNPLKCENILMDNKSFPPDSTNFIGKFNLLGQPFKTSTTLVNISDTTINLSGNANNFATHGIVTIGNEAIWYSKKSGSQLLDIKRGVMGTPISTYPTNSQVTQNMCLLTSIAGVPDMTNTSSKRTIKKILVAGPPGVGLLPDDITPALVVAGSVSLTGSSDVHNNSVTIGGSNFAKSTIVSGGPVVLNNAARTRVGSNDTVASSPNHFLTDINQNNSAINLSTIWGYFFDQSKNELKNDPATTIVTNCNSFDFTTATGVIWLTGDFALSKNITIGSITNPVTIITETNAHISGNFTLNGMLYVMGSLAAQGSSRINGIAVVEGAVNLNGSNDIYYDPEVLAALNLLKSGYNKYGISWEDFN